MANYGMLSDRDLALLRLLDRTPATTPLILKASSTFPPGRFRDERRVRERLQTLAAMRVVRAFPAAQAIGGPVNWYKLSPEGFRVLHGPDAALPHRSRFEAISPSRFHHTQTLAEVVIHVLSVANASRVSVLRYFGDGELTVEGAGHRLHPDCFFQLAHAGRQFNVMFEIDHATESLDSTAANAVRQKLQVYEAHQDAAWQWWKQRGAGMPRPYFRVVFLTTTAERASHFLWLAGECARNRDRHLCYAAAQDTFLGSADSLLAPLVNDHHGRWQAIVDPHPTSHFTRTPLRLSPPVTIPGVS